MDFKKIILYVAFAFVGLTLWNQWQQDYPQKSAATAKSTQNAATTAKTANANDIPDIPASNHAATTSNTAAQIPQATSSTTDKLIKIKTDLFDLAIDPRGGNIVKLNLSKYPLKLNSNKPFPLLFDGSNHQYVAQSGLVGLNGPDTKQGQALYTSAKTSYSLMPNQQQLVVNLQWQNPQGLKVTKSFIFNRDSYQIKVVYKVNNQSSTAWTGNLYTQLKQQTDPVKRSLYHFSTYTGASLSSSETPYEKIAFKDIAEKPLSRSIQGGWLAMQQHYFLSAWIPNAKTLNHYYTKFSGSNIYTIGQSNPQLTVLPGKAATTAATLYAGPEDTARLKAVAPHLELTVDYGWLWFISNIIFWLMTEIHKVVGNWGWSIVLVTALIKAVFYKLSATSYRSMANMRRLQPKLKTLKDRYGDDKQKFSQATMELYRKEKVNPLAGCLPMLVQIPVFIALYYVLIESVQLRQAPFIFWIHDLSIKDPYYILPLLFGALMFLQQKLNPTPPDPMQAKVMMILPVVFTFLFLNFPSGLVLYWVVNNSLSILQQWYITRKIEKDYEAKSSSQGMTSKQKRIAKQKG